MDNIYKKLIYSLKWLSLESITYQILLLIHQIFLFKMTKLNLYGILGTIFSFVYLLVTITNLGLEGSLSPFFKKITENKRSLRSFLLLQLIPSILISFLSFIFLSTASDGFNLFLNQKLIILLSCLILLESIKKTLRAILYLSFLNKINTYVEIASLLAYIGSVWTYFFITNKITINSIFVPMFVTSFLATTTLFLFTRKIYQKLPSKNKRLSFSHLSIIKCRLLNFLNQFGHSLFSSNFMVPFFAAQFGFAQAGIFKLISHISYSTTSLMRKIFGWLCDTMLSQTKDMRLETKQAIFSSISQILHHVLYMIAIFLIINLNKIMTYSKVDGALVNWPLIALFLIITLSENLFIIYEKFYIAEEKNKYTLLINIFSILLLASIINFNSHISQFYILLLIATSRLSILSVLGFVSFRLWAIKPTYHVKPKYIALSLLVSLAIFIIL